MKSKIICGGLNQIFLLIVIILSFFGFESSPLLASGGNEAEREYHCVKEPSDKNGPLMRFRLHMAFSSEIRGDVLVYSNASNRDQMLTSLEQCFETNMISIEPKVNLASTATTSVVCGRPLPSKDPTLGHAKLTVNSAFYRAVLWIEGREKKDIKARLERIQQTGNIENIFGELTCLENKPG